STRAWTSTTSSSVSASATTISRLSSLWQTKSQHWPARELSGTDGRQPGRQLGGRCNLHVCPPEKGVSVTSEKRDVKHQRRQEVSMWRIDVRTVAVFR